MKVKVNDKPVEKFESTKYDDCEFGKGNHCLNKINIINKNPTTEQSLIRIILCLYIQFTHINKYSGIQVTATTQRASQIHMRCSQVDVYFKNDAIGYMSIKHQVDINPTKTVKYKPIFERYDQSKLVVTNGYHNDNYVFK